MSRFDHVFRAAALPGRDGLADVAVAGGRIVDIGTGFTCEAGETDVGGRLLFAGFVETHIHLDKAGIVGRCRICAGTLAEAVAETARAKAAFTVEDVYERAARVVEKAILAGTTRLRTFVEVDPRVDLRAFEAIRAVKARYAAAIEIEMCAFAQEGLTNEPATEVLIDRALADGADLVGGCPYTDPDPAEHVRRIFALAERHGVAVDFHLDFDLDPTRSDLPTVIAETVARGYGGRVSVGHVTKLSAVAPEVFAETGRRLADAGVAVTVLPATDLYLTGRGADRLVPRGVTPAHRLAALGVTASIATNNVLNPFTPFGDASLIRMANLYATVAQAGTAEELATVFRMVSDMAARILSPTRGHGVAVGAPADLVILDAPSPAAAVAEIATPRAAWKNGRPVFDRPAVARYWEAGAAGPLTTG
ncbi:amidohydrolase family protein [Oharaeibacter diazotrophicus]|uniref:Cytosine deaminase n=1 Tax=Oharaeibacter diazotrophicus TaxID=1920512 RepID=A0A4R6R5H7_9HYPH|nr:amidohydrolase family protein [Oharaeibacter diazotrophicus]TDP81191.1 cytosine deaminase [Oharaeibacter diazotrophicus]BBE74815.1 cytosine deaminase [Pleomorphomonas sp. SM30]GLS75681.1 amidohydrolase [Oharaeibacter diazotrophicus]